MLEMFRNLARSVFGMNHVKGTENQYLEIVGNGLDAEHPRNARTLDIAGNETLAGRLTVGAQPVDDNDVATKKYVDDNASGGSGGGGIVFADYYWHWDDLSDDPVVSNYTLTTAQMAEAVRDGKLLVGRLIMDSGEGGAEVYTIAHCTSVMVSSTWKEFRFADEDLKIQHENEGSDDVVYVTQNTGGIS